jgi:hypothetical protein
MSDFCRRIGAWSPTRGLSKQFKPSCLIPGSTLSTQLEPSLGVGLDLRHRLLKGRLVRRMPLRLVIGANVRK